MLNITKIIFWISYWLYIQQKQFSQRFVSQKPYPVEEKKNDYKGSVYQTNQRYIHVCFMAF